MLTYMTINPLLHLGSHKTILQSLTMIYLQIDKCSDFWEHILLLHRQNFFNPSQDINALNFIPVTTFCPLICE